MIYREVTLLPAELAMTEIIARWRQEAREAAGDRNAYGATGGSELHLLGIRGELAFAKMFGQYPSGMFRPKETDDDVNGTQIRTRSRWDMDLFLWKKDPDEAFYALMTTDGSNKFFYHGCIYGKEAKKEKFWTLAGPVFPRVDCYVIPQAVLEEDPWM